MSFYNERNKWLSSGDTLFLASCKLENFKSTGPGGQRKNKKNTAVRIRHIPTGITVTAENYREQSANKRNAVKKLKIQIAVYIRGPEITLPRNLISISSDEFPLWLAKFFDTFIECGYQIRETAEKLSLSPSRLIKIIYKNHTAWEYVNKLRIAGDLPALNISK